VFDFFIIDLIIFAFISYLISIVITLVFGIIYKDIFDLYPLISFVLLILLMFSNYKYRYKNKFDNKSALQILEFRYANGEINKEEFEEMKNTICDSQN